mmetsp:Transcript_75478/g.230852  ORF Transcript_75478/g.230852 Transcript_75478/m.230852 type:complete len:106 (-) Transcript_75478:41-358(-)
MPKAFAHASCTGGASLPPVLDDFGVAPSDCASNDPEAEHERRADGDAVGSSSRPVEPKATAAARRVAKRAPSRRSCKGDAALTGVPETLASGAAAAAVAFSKSNK